MERLTARNANNIAYLVNVKPNEQEVESSYPNTLRCIVDSFERLAQYEDTGLLPEDIEKQSKKKSPPLEPDLKPLKITHDILNIKI